MKTYKFKDMSEDEKTFVLSKNRSVFIDFYGLPEGGDEKHYKSNDFLRDFFERNDIEFDYVTNNAIME